ncbi:glutamate racemase [Peptococcus simiae]|uniref:Glutamate racemase n=1 Tax=Peptococcus simiae TaxID=1643805 RepID=A0ABW9GX72_9FIRM
MRPVAIFDSGIGGLTVMAEVQRRMPHLPLIFYADQDHVPYGNKTPERIRAYMIEVLEDLKPYNIQALLLACNTATSAAADFLRAQTDFPIVGMEPAVKPAVLKEAVDKKILVSATDLTLRLDKLTRLIKNLAAEDRVQRLSLQELVAFAEKGDFDSPAVEQYLRDQLQPYDLSTVGALVLGCTHFLYFKPLLEAILPPAIDIIDGNAGTVKQLQKLIVYHEDGQGAEPRPQFIVSGRPASKEEDFFQACLRRS